MLYTTVCPVCSRLYQEQSRDEADSPNRMCTACWQSRGQPPGDLVDVTFDVTVMIANATNARAAYKRLMELLSDDDVAYFSSDTYVVHQRTPSAGDSEPRDTDELAQDGQANGESLATTSFTKRPRGS